MSDGQQFQPLAARMRPQQLTEYVGQQHLLAPGRPLYQAVKQGILHSMILWGPPGCGKTTLARLLAQTTQAHVEVISAVLAGVKDIRQVIDKAKLIRAQYQKKTILFVDEVHRFNKSQQDAFLPHVEEGDVVLIGATTENPSFELNNALLSRAKVYVLQRLSEEDLRQLLQQVLYSEKGLAHLQVNFSDHCQQILLQAADGDARRLLNFMEMLSDFADQKQLTITEEMIAQILQSSLRRFDKGGEAFYDQISALHKSVRGSSPDAALYWLSRMLDGGCDPLYVARRVVRMASEDIGNADPRALEIALNAWQVQERLGSPEGELAIAQAVVYMACAAKSNAVYTAFKQAQHDAKQFGSLEVPVHLRNAPTKLMKSLDYGKHYRYAHDEPDAYAAGENYFPDAMAKKQYYQPVPRGLEIKITEKLQWLQQKDKEVQHVEDD